MSMNTSWKKRSAWIFPTPSATRTTTSHHCALILKMSTLLNLKLLSVKVTGDMLSHIMLQHGHTFKISFPEIFYQRFVPLKSLIDVDGLLFPMIRHNHFWGETFVRLTCRRFWGDGAYRQSNYSTSTAAADSFQSSIVLNFPTSEAVEISKSSLSHVDDFIRKKKNQQLQGLGTQALTFILAKKKGKRSRGRLQSKQNLWRICCFQLYLVIS